MKIGLDLSLTNQVLNQGDTLLPDSIEGIVLWLDADDDTTLSLSGSNVTQWDDLSGNDNHATPLTTDVRPKSGTRTINSKNAIEFDGTDFLETPDLELTEYTEFIVFQADNVITDGASLTTAIMGGAGGKDTRYIRRSDLWLWEDGVQAIPSTNISTNGVYISTASHDATTLDAELRLNGESQGVVNRAMPTGGTTPYRIGAFSTNLWYDGVIAEIIVYDRVLSAAEKQQVEAYLTAKWKAPLTSSIPSGADVHVFLTAGQSNNVGLAPFDSGANYSSRVFEMNHNGELVAASTTLDNIDPYTDLTNTMGLQMQFSIDYLADNPDAYIIFVPAAVGDSGFTTGQWVVDGDLYNYAVNTTNTLLAKFPSYSFKGVLWHQGEKDSGNASYEAQLHAMIVGMRADITGADATTPFILGEMVIGGAATNATIQAIINDTPNNVDDTAVASATGLGHIGDNLHFNAAAFRTFGSRYYTAYQNVIAPFSPLDVSPSLWLKSDDAATITASGGAVSQWADKSGYGNHAEQSLSERKPTTGANTINGKNVITFDGVDNFLNIVDSASVSFTGDVTFIMVGCVETGGDANKTIVGKSATGAYRWRIDGGTNKQWLRINDGTTATVVRSDSGITLGAPTVLMVEADLGGNASFYKDSALDGTPSMPRTSIADIVNDLTIGGEIVSESFKGDIAELILIPRLLTTEEKSNLDAYWNTEWGV